MTVRLKLFNSMSLTMLPEHNGCNSDVILHFACNVCTHISHNYDPDYPTDNKSLSQNGSDNG